MSHVVVVGAGVAGLTCAWALRERGHDVEVLEGGQTLGGRVRSKRIDGFPFERGARWFGDDPVVRGVLSRLGLSDRVRRLDAPSFVLGPTGLTRTEPVEALLPGEPMPKGHRLTLVDGLSRLTRALAEPLTVRLGWGAEAVESDALGVRIRYITPSGERLIRAEATVLAMPSVLARALAPELPHAPRPAPVVLGRYGLVHIGLSDPITEGDVRVPSAAGVDLAGWSVTRCSEGSAMRVALWPEAVERLWSAPDSAWIDHVTGQLERTPIGKIEPVLSRVDRFHDAPAEIEGPLWSRRVGVTGAAGSVAGAVTRGTIAAAGAHRVLRARVIE